MDKHHVGATIDPLVAAELDDLPRQPETRKSKAAIRRERDAWALAGGLAGAIVGAVTSGVAWPGLLTGVTLGGLVGILSAMRQHDSLR